MVEIKEALESLGEEGYELFTSKRNNKYIFISFCYKKAASLNAPLLIHILTLEEMLFYGLRALC